MYLVYRFLESLGINERSSQNLVFVYVLVIFIAQVLRLIIFIGYQVSYSSFKISAKDLKTRSDIGSLKSGVIGKIAKDYTKVCEKGIAGVNARAIVKKHLLRMRFVYWTFDSMSRFVAHTENQVVLLGALLALCVPDTVFAAVLCLLLYGLTRVLAASFDFEHSGLKLENEIVEYLEREIGQFFILDMNSGLKRLNAVMAEGTANQTRAVESSVKGLGETLGGVLKLTVSEIHKNIDDTVKTINSYSEYLKQPLEQWRSAVEYAAESQSRINEASKGLRDAASDFKETAKAAGESFSGYIVKLETEKEFLNNQIESLKNMSISVNAGADLALSNKGSLETALSYVEKNQSVLEESLARYELALEQITGKLGDALGSMLNYHIENSYNALNNEMSSNINTIIRSNSQLTGSLQNLFEEMSEHMKLQLKTIINLKEQIDSHLENSKCIVME